MSRDCWSHQVIHRTPLFHQVGFRHLSRPFSSSWNWWFGNWVPPTVTIPESFSGIQKRESKPSNAPNHEFNQFTIRYSIQYSSPLVWKKKQSKDFRNFGVPDVTPQNHHDTKVLKCPQIDLGDAAKMKALPIAGWGNKKSLWFHRSANRIQ